MLPPCYLQGACCASILDAAGVCCPSGAVDECGVCEGNGGTCGLHLRLLVGLPANASSAGSGATVSSPGASVSITQQVSAWAQSLLQSALQQAGYPADQVAQLRVEKLSAVWAAVNDINITTPSAARHLTQFGGHVSSTNGGSLVGSLGEASSGTVAQGGPSASTTIPSTETLGARPQPGYLPPLCEAGTAPAAAPPEAASSLLAAKRACSRLPQDETEHPSLGPGRRLQQALSYLPAVLDVVIDTRSVVLDNMHPAGQGQSSSTFGFLSSGTLGLGVLLATNVEAAAAAATSTGQAAAQTDSLLLIQVLLAQRLGVCGNGVCEVGERTLTNDGGGVLQQAMAPCPQVGILRLVERCWLVVAWYN